MNKKGADLPLTIIIIALILITTAIIVLAVFTGLFKKEGSEIDKKIQGIGDYDEDGTINMFDKCPCVYGEEYSGCKEEKEGKDYTNCPDSMKPKS